VSLQSAFWPAGTIACRFNLRLTRRNLGAPASRRPLVPKEQLKIAPRFNAGGEKTNKTSPERTAEKNQAKNVKNSNRSPALGRPFLASKPASVAGVAARNAMD